MEEFQSKARVGLIGYGYWGRNYHRALSELKGVEVTYVCDANSSFRDRVLGNISFFDDPQKAIAEGGVDAIFVITPAETHKEITINALKNGLNLFVEKPALLSSSDLNIVLSQKRRNTLFFPGHIYAYNDMVKSFVKSIKETGEEINSATSLRMALGPVRNDVGCIWDLLPHDLTIFDLLNVGKPVSVSCKAQYPLKLNHEDIAHCNIHYSTNFVASVELNWIFPNKVRKTSVITNKSLYSFDETNKDLPIGFIKFENGIPEGANKVAYSRLTANQYINGIDFPRSEPLKNMIKTFLGAVTSNNQEGDRDEIIRAKMIISTIEAIIKSIHDDGRMVNIK